MFLKLEMMSHKNSLETVKCYNSLGILNRQFLFRTHSFNICYAVMPTA